MLQPIQVVSQYAYHDAYWLFSIRVLAVFYYEYWLFRYFRLVRGLDAQSAYMYWQKGVIS